MEYLPDILSRARGARALVVGDVMLDRFVYGHVGRISPEAPVPVLHHARETMMPGGAANVARNLASLGLAPVLIGGRGPDQAGDDLARILSGEQAIRVCLADLPDRPTSVKCRFVSGGHQLLRLDIEQTGPVGSEAEEEIIRLIRREAEAASIILLSDYAKGLLSARVIEAALEAGARSAIPVIADPKGLDFAKYGAVDILKPNASELAAATGLPAGTDIEVEAALKSLARLVPAKTIIVTRAARGMSCLKSDCAILHRGGRAQEVFDVSGAGDTSLAAIAAAIAGGGGIEQALELAIAASGLAVGKAGTATVSVEELSAAIGTGAPVRRPGLLSLEEMIGQVERWRASGLRVGFTNGCFDILHPGHVRVIEQARAQCDRLVVGLNADVSVRRLKGAGRPVNDEQARAAVLSALSCVDGVVIFDTDTPYELIRALSPDLLVKGGDYTRAGIVGADLVEARGGRVLIIPLLEGHSTTATIARSHDGGA